MQHELFEDDIDVGKKTPARGKKLQLGKQNM